MHNKDLKVSTVSGPRKKDSGERQALRQPQHGGALYALGCCSDFDQCSVESRGPAMHPKDVGPYSTLSDTPQLTLGYITNLSKPQFLGL